MPSGRTACPHITDNKDGTVTVKYSPTERGLHEMDIKYDGNHIPGNTSACFHFIFLFFDLFNPSSQSLEMNSRVSSANSLTFR